MGSPELSPVFDEEVARLSAIVESSEDAIVTISVSGAILSWNVGAVRVYGYAEEEVVGKPMVSLVQKNRVDEEADILRRIRLGERIENLETVRIHKDGRAIPVSLTVSPIRNRVGEIIGASHVTRDLSERLAYARAKAQLAAIVESSEDAIIGMGLDGTILTWNEGAERMYGYTAAESKGRFVGELAPEELADSIADTLKRVRAGERLRAFETVGLRKGGQRIDILLSISPIRGVDGEISGASHMARDISEAKNLRQKLQTAQKMEAVGRLAGGVAHDFNNLLTVISGYCELLTMSLTGDEENLQMVNEITGAAQRAADLTRQMLAFSRGQAVQRRVLNLNELISKAQGMLRRLIGEDVTVKLSLFEPLWKINADPGQISQIVMNLSANARDAMPEGGLIVIQTENFTIEERRPDLAGVEPGRYVRVLFTDTGHGMDAETRQHIFEPFFTTKDFGKGTGLGLAGVYAIVQQSRGYISVYSEPNCGTTFAIYLPIAETDEAIPEAAPAAPSQGVETILLAEDEPGLRRLAASVLRGNGYTVIEAGNADEAIALLEKDGSEVKLLVTDIVMPGGSGQKLAREIANLQPGIRRIFMSGYSEHTVLQSILSEPRNLFLQKPFTPLQLLRKVREALDA